MRCRIDDVSHMASPGYGVVCEGNGGQHEGKGEPNANHKEKNGPPLRLKHGKEHDANEADCKKRKVIRHVRTEIPSKPTLGNRLRSCRIAAA